jgi:predicted nucleic acid-binding protein
VSLAWEQKLRGADAIHLAAARQIGNQASRRSLEFVLVSADNELLRAAKSFELAVTNPAVIT